MSEEDSRSDSEPLSNHAIVEEICEPFILSDDKYRQIRDIFLDEIGRGLCKYTFKNAYVKFLMTFVEKLPSGCERGNFLGLDLDGTTLRILLINLRSEEGFQIEGANYELPESLLTGPGHNLFDFLAECLSKFVYKYELQEDELSLGFIFSFPLKQNKLTGGVLLSWTKGFSCSDVVGRDVVGLLQQAIERRGDIHIPNIVILNETTGKLIACAWQYREAKIGLVIDTALSISYLEKTKHIDQFKGGVNASPTMIINCKSDNFGNDGLLDFVRTPIDFTLDENSVNAGQQIFEKMTSSKYLGEIVRLIMLKCVDAKAMLRGNHSEQLRTPMSFNIKLMSNIEAEETGNDSIILYIFEKMGYRRPSVEDCEHLRYICKLVSNRSAYLIAATLAALINHIGDPFVIIGVDGSVYRQYPRYSERLRKKLRKLARPEYTFCLKLAEYGPGVGAALLAATTFAKKGNP
uniref:Phosphotransferase n=1 Tax=Glossina pallidipes TaxID=7398 RepID=A0A1A9ZTJ3_GLOPL